ncbi:MAG: TonB-dependent receptor plug domain-containing protein, partial [Candidatus Brocadia sp.]
MEFSSTNMTNRIANGLSLVFVSLTLFHLWFLFFNSSRIFAEGTDTASIAIKEATQSTGIISNNKENDVKNMEVAVAEEFATEAIWFGLKAEVTIATRLETPVSKAPSIVAVITAEEIKNLGYRTFVEILRTVPGFEILKTASLGETMPAVRGL